MDATTGLVTIVALGLLAFVGMSLVVALIRRRGQSKNVNCSSVLAFVRATVVGGVVATLVFGLFLVGSLVEGRLGAVPADSTVVLAKANMPNADGEVDASKAGAWVFRYPNSGFETARRLFVPAGRNVALEIQSGDIARTFACPSLQLKQSAVPGSPARTWFNAGYLPEQARPVYLGLPKSVDRSLLEGRIATREMLRLPVSVDAEAVSDYRSLVRELTVVFQDEGLGDIHQVGSLLSKGGILADGLRKQQADLVSAVLAKYEIEVQRSSGDYIRFEANSHAFSNTDFSVADNSRFTGQVYVLPEADYQLFMKVLDNFRKPGVPVADLGREVFLANCASCHYDGQTGASIGPKWTGIYGQTRTIGVGDGSTKTTITVDDAYIYESIRFPAVKGADGYTDKMTQFTEAMLSDDEIAAVTQYIKQVSGVEPSSWDEIDAAREAASQ